MLVGAGLTTTLAVEATVAQWVLYQFVAGFGRGCGMQTVSHSAHELMFQLPFSDNEISLCTAHHRDPKRAAARARPPWFVLGNLHTDLWRVPRPDNCPAGFLVVFGSGAAQVCSNSQRASHHSRRSDRVPVRRFT